MSSAGSPPATPKMKPGGVPPPSVGGIVSAARPRTNSGTQPAISATKTNPGLAVSRLKSEAENVGLNAIAVVKEGWTDFQGTSRFFKYKVIIGVIWVLLSAVSAFIAWPETTPGKMGARLYQPASGSNVFMIKNEGELPWNNVLIIVNTAYRLATPNISPMKDVTFNPKQLTGPDGTVAPPELQIHSIELRMDEGRVKLLENGREL